MVVGIQSKPEIFKFTNYRLRTHLYTKNLKNVDHVYLSGNTLNSDMLFTCPDIKPDEYDTYIDALKFNPVEESPGAHYLKGNGTSSLKMTLQKHWTGGAK
jgi:hypothetical protein